MRRREFLAAFGSAAAWAAHARAQQSNHIRRIGLLSFTPETDLVARRLFGTFVQELHRLGWVDGRNLKIEIRRATGGITTQVLADELVKSQPDIILVTSTPGVRFLKQATDAIPIMFIGVSDPVRDGFVASLARPGGNITGFSNYEPQIGTKWYELLKAVAPQVTKVIIPFNPNTAPHSLYVEPMLASAPSFGLEAVPAHIQTIAELGAVLSRLGQGAGWGMVVIPDSFIVAHRGEVSELATRHLVPAVYPFRLFAMSGGLLSYGVDQVDQYTRAATYVDRILKGEKPANLPVQGPAKFETVINLKTARTLGLEVPNLLLAGADEVIE